MTKIIWGTANTLHCVAIYWCALLCFHAHRKVRQKKRETAAPNNSWFYSVYCKILQWWDIKEALKGQIWRCIFQTIIPHLCCCCF